MTGGYGRYRGWLRQLGRIGGVAVLGLAALSPASAQVAFRDSMFAVARTEGIVYGTAPIGNPPGPCELLLDLYTPLGPGAPVLRPGYVVIHGGAFYTGGRDDALPVRIATEMAARGYVAISIDYRLGGQEPVPSAEFQQLAQATGTTVAAAVEDGTTAYRWLVANASDHQIDADRIAVGGPSVGATIGMTMAWVLDDFSVAVEPPVAVVADFWGTIGIYRENLECGEAPFVIVHGTADPASPITDALQLMAHADTACVGIDTLSVAYEFYPVPGAGHGDFDIFTLEAAPDTTLFEKTVYFLYDHFDPPLPVAVAHQAPATTPPVLHRIYPNPCNSGTTVTFALDRSQHARIVIYDVAGARLAVLVDQVLAAGEHAVVWRGIGADGRALPSGVYGVRLDTEAGGIAQKLLLLR